MRLVVIGCGYLGATHAACMAELGHEVLGLDADVAKVGWLSDGEVPFFEPHLQGLMRKHVDSGALSFTSSVEEAAAFADLFFLCVGTPQHADSLGADLTSVVSAVDELAPLLTRPCTVVGKSTVPVGTADRLATRIAELAPAGKEVELAWNPEFLREGHAVTDTLSPERLVLGVRSAHAEHQLRQVYAQMIAAGTPVIVTDYATAELGKVSANAFLATKISFINAMAEICEVTGADVGQLADVLGHDSRIGRAFLNAGLGYGGGCLAKDLHAFVHRAGELGIPESTAFLREVDATNQRRRQRVVDLATQMLCDGIEGARVSVLGASFKPNSDDIRDSPALWVAGQLHLAGAVVTVYDPEAMLNARRLYPTLAYANSIHDACVGADILLHLTEWTEFRRADPADLGRIVAGRRVLDGRNCLDVNAWRRAGWDYRALGRP